eukprot:6478730-Amphidinium_carterae.1
MQVDLLLVRQKGHCPSRQRIVQNDMKPLSAKPCRICTQLRFRQWPNSIHAGCSEHLLAHVELEKAKGSVMNPFAG